jgi:hypothetical protein
MKNFLVKPILRSIFEKHIKLPGTKIIINFNLVLLIATCRLS